MTLQTVTSSLLNKLDEVPSHLLLPEDTRDPRVLVAWTPNLQEVSAFPVHEEDWRIRHVFHDVAALHYNKDA